MTNIVSQPIKPFVTEEGIELYATETECGMSQRGLSLFCGVSSDSVFKLISNLTDRQNVPEILQPFVGQELTLSANFEKSAKVYKSNLCAAVCTYYAYISKAANETARFSLGKFASMGIDSWIRKATGHEQTSALSLEQLTINLLQEKIEWQSEKLLMSEKITITTEQLLDKERYITKATINAPGLTQILETAQEVDGVALPEVDKELYTLLEWLEEFKGIQLPDKAYRQFRLKVAGLFQTLRHHTPKKERRWTPANSPVMSYVYEKSDFHYLDTVLSQVIAAYRP